MAISKLMGIGLSALFLQTLPCHAGPCSRDIDRVLAAIDAKLNALAAAGPSQKQDAGAQMHRQPTPRSIAEAERNAGAVPPGIIQKVTEAMTRARAADAAGDTTACEGALNEAVKLLSE